MHVVEPRIECNADVEEADHYLEFFLQAYGNATTVIKLDGKIVRLLDC